MKDVFLVCINNVLDVDLKNRLNNCLILVENAESEYHEKIINHTLHTIRRNKSTKANKTSRVIGGFVTINEMKDVYTSNFVPLESAGRSIYDKIKSSAPNSKCPYCLHRVVTTLDHYLPKAYYPLLSVTPVNLVPSCTDCNKDKTGDCPNADFEEKLHPYFDVIPAEKWLEADVVHEVPTFFRFIARPPEHWDELLCKRIEFHFNSLSLNDLYSIEAANELGNIRLELETRLSEEGIHGVQAWLADGVRTREAANQNSWVSAMYRAMAADDWFCSGGFRLPVNPK